MWPFEAGYPERRVSELRDEYDFVIVGGGTAGCVLARRLAEERRWSVLLVERGDARDNWLDRSPMFSAHWFSDGKHSTTLPGRLWGEKAAEVIIGKGLGGTSRINGIQYTRGVPGMYNAWAESGCPGWSYDELRPYFERAEGLWSPSTQAHNRNGGPLQVEAPSQNFRFGVSTEIVRAAEKLGFPLASDVNDASMPSSGTFRLHLTTGNNGHRSSTFRAYLPKEFALAESDHLDICTKTLVRKIEVERTVSGTLRSAGVLLQEGRPGSCGRFIAARKEVLVCCGAIMSPQLLLLSGIGPAKHLQDVGIPVAHELSGVGSNLQDHMGTPLFFYAPIWDTYIALFLKPWWLLWQIIRYLFSGDGWLRDYYVEAHIYTRTDFLEDDLAQKTLGKAQSDSALPMNVPNIEVMMGAICDFRAADFDRSKGGYQLLANVLQPRSRGSVRLRSSDPFDPPAVDLAFLSAHADRPTLRTAVKLCMRIAETMRTGGYATSAFRAPASSDDDAVDEFIDGHSKSFWHYSSTCRMAPLEESEPGVVDHELRVHGISNLRICDASVFPQIPAAHLMAPVIAVAEKCADMVKRAAVEDR